MKRPLVFLLLVLPLLAAAPAGAHEWSQEEVSKTAGDLIDAYSADAYCWDVQVAIMEPRVSVRTGFAR